MVFVDVAGKVGINNASPAAELDVTGTVMATLFQGKYQRTYPGYTTTGNTGYRTKIIDLEDTQHVWSWPKALRLIQHTSWFQELGAPPIHGILVINNARNAIDWLDYDNQTLAPYMTFTQAGGNLLGTGQINGFDFKDFRLTVATVGNGWNVDLLSDEHVLYSSEPHVYRWNQNTAGRNNTLGAAVKMRTSDGIVSSTCYATSIGRDPSGAREMRTGRPLHYITFSTNDGTNPHTILRPNEYGLHTAYNVGTGYGLSPVASVLTDAGAFVSTSVTAGGSLSDYVALKWNIGSWTASGQTFDTAIHNSASNPIDGSATVQAIDALDNGSLSNPSLPLIAAGYDISGLVLINVDSGGKHAYRKLFSSYFMPYIKDASLGAWCLDSLTDHGARGHTLTNVGSVPFTGVSPFGTPCADFDAASTHYLYVNDHADFTSSYGEFTMSAYVKPETLAQQVHIVAQMNHNSGTELGFWMAIGASQEPAFGIKTGGTWHQHNGVASSVKTGEWAHLCGVYDGSYFTTYLNGIPYQQSAATGALYNTADPITFGVRWGSGAPVAGQYYDGLMANVSLQHSAWSIAEVQSEYLRMRFALEGATTALGSDNIKSVRIDKNSGYVIATAANNVAYVIDPATGLIVETIALASGTINDADIAHFVGGLSPQVVLGGHP